MPPTGQLLTEGLPRPRLCSRGLDPVRSIALISWYEGSTLHLRAFHLKKKKQKGTDSASFLEGLSSESRRHTESGEQLPQDLEAWVLRLGRLRPPGKETSRKLLGRDT